ncbi:hypothetical protein [Lysinibacillus sp. JNUCC 51]|uniref:hypothetical protein n=1 Tax=Lysinibacillus sp. JNUCC-51 TaxID=2792479 RepID=UPI0019371451|nr:hypothetical protein JNUCC51_16005 [Lysinibacillus sp. JNUCC-51]
MNNLKLKVACFLCIGFIFLGVDKEVNAANWDPEDIDQLDNNTMPDEVKERLKLENQPELDEVNKEDYPQYNPNLTPSDGIIVPYATKIYPGASTSDSRSSSNFGGKGQNVIYGKVDNGGTWSSLAYYSFSGWGYTGYSGAGTISDMKSTVSVSATGVIPNISTDGSAWSLLKGTKTIATAGKIKGEKYAQSNFSNVKIQNISTLYTVFENESYLNISGVGSETWYEDIWFWF